MKVNILFSYVAIQLLISLAIPVSAGCGSTGCTSEVEHLIVFQSVVRVKPNESEAELQEVNCSLYNGAYIELQDGLNSDRMFSVLLAAQRSGEKIQMRIHDQSDPCVFSYVRSYPNGHFD